MTMAPDSPNGNSAKSAVNHLAEFLFSFIPDPAANPRYLVATESQFGVELLDRRERDSASVFFTTRPDHNRRHDTMLAIKTVRNSHGVIFGGTARRTCILCFTLLIFIFFTCFRANSNA